MRVASTKLTLASFPNKQNLSASRKHRKGVPFSYACSETSHFNKCGKVGCFYDDSKCG